MEDAFRRTRPRPCPTHPGSPSISIATASTKRSRRKTRARVEHRVAQTVASPESQRSSFHALHSPLVTVRLITVPSYLLITPICTISTSVCMHLDPDYCRLVHEAASGTHPKLAQAEDELHANERGKRNFILCVEHAHHGHEGHTSRNENALWKL